MIVPYSWAERPERWPNHVKDLEKLVIKRALELGSDAVGTDLVGVMSSGP